MLLEDGTVKDAIIHAEPQPKAQKRIFEDVISVKTPESEKFSIENKEATTQNNQKGLNSEEQPIKNKQPKPKGTSNPEIPDQNQLMGDYGEKINIGNDIFICPRVNIKWADYNWPIFCKIGNQQLLKESPLQLG